MFHIQLRVSRGGKNAGAEDGGMGNIHQRISAGLQRQLEVSPAAGNEPPGKAAPGCPRRTCSGDNQLLIRRRARSENGGAGTSGVHPPHHRRDASAPGQHRPAGRNTDCSRKTHTRHRLRQETVRRGAQKTFRHRWLRRQEHRKPTKGR